MTNPALSIEYLPLDKLIPYAGNTRTHTPQQIAAIAASIRKFGFTNPVLISAADDIIAGHARVQAARLAGLTEAPVIRLGHLTDAERRAYVIADNRLAEKGAGWDAELLRAEIDALTAEGFDFTVTGWDEADLAALFGKPTDALLTDPDSVPDVPVVPISVPGDMWVCGDHRVRCGDATMLDDVEALMAGELADMCFTDPPYNVNYANSAKDKMRGKNRAILNDNLGDGFGAFLHDSFVNILTVTKGAVYVCMSSSELDVLQKAFRDAGGKWSTFIIWAKNQFSMGRSDYQRQYEPILYGWKDGTSHFWCGARNQGDVWSVDKPRKNDLHPTMKPVVLVERAIENSSKSRDIVLDLFGGSGTTMIASQVAGRRARLLELDPKYVDVIVQRWQDATGLQAIHAVTGAAFARSDAPTKDSSDVQPIV